MKGRRGRAGLLRGFTGLLAGGLVALVVVLAIAWAVAIGQNAPGPGIALIVWHVVAAVGAVLAQRYADRHAGWLGAVAALAVVAITAAVIVLLWIA